MKKFRSLRTLLNRSQRDVNKGNDPLEVPNDTDGDENHRIDRRIIFNDEAHFKERNQLLSAKKKNGRDVDESKSLESVTEEDLRKALEAIEISDFDVCISNDSDEVDTRETSSKEGGNVGNTDPLKREEVFSRRYRPSKSESKELQELAKHLRASPLNISLTSCQHALHELIFGEHSIILKKGRVRFNDKDCDLILLTDGFMAIHQNPTAYNPLGSRYETCQLWSALEFVEIANFGILRIHMKSGESFEICCYSNQENTKGWLHAIEQIVILYALHNSNDSTITDTFGWQYEQIRKPAFSAAVGGDIKLLGNSPNINELDGYNQCSPLHYAIQRKPCSVDIIDALLRAGADPNLPDGEGRSAMYYAQQNKLNDIEEILKRYGGKKSALVEIERKGELFGGVDEANRKTTRRREIEEAIKDNKAADVAARVQSAESQMDKNMKALIERGEKINAISDKAQHLNDEAKTYGELASQLRNQSKDKKWYQL
mmetsp:Transcript_11074/g.26594  ORF Transcript_11074/g.26594 Transcript_11074/m.26594 type:complete len:487 (+) Transcript_11074:63-1523(+)